MISLRTALLAAFFLWASYQYTTAKSPTPVECCFRYVSGPIRRDKLVDFYATPSECHLTAVVLETKAGHQVCADPSESWVKRAMRLLQTKRKQTSLSKNHR